MRAVLILLVLISPGVMAERHGEVRLHDGEQQAYLGDSNQWVSIPEFWAYYVATESRGIAWGSGVEYPPYNDVNELDTFQVQLESGPCLMEFFHSRWRRAQDVRRWDPAFNDYGGCPHVFD